MKSALLKKTTWIFLVLAMAFATTSCEDDEATIDSTLIAGTWTLETADLNSFTIDGKNFVDYYVSEMGLSSEEAQLYYAVLAAFAEEMSGTITMNEDGTYTATMDGEEDAGVWELNGNILTMDKGTEDETEITVKSLSASKLSIVMTETEEEDVNEDGKDETTVMTMTLNFTK